MVLHFFFCAECDVHKTHNIYIFCIRIGIPHQLTHQRIPHQLNFFIIIFCSRCQIFKLIEEHFVTTHAHTRHINNLVSTHGYISKIFHIFIYHGDNYDVTTLITNNILCWHCEYLETTYMKYIFIVSHWKHNVRDYV